MRFEYILKIASDYLYAIVERTLSDTEDKGMCA